MLICLLPCHKPSFCILTFDVRIHPKHLLMKTWFFLVLSHLVFSRFLIPRAINVSYTCNRMGVILYLCMVLFAFYILLIILNVVLAFLNMILMSMSDYPVLSTSLPMLNMLMMLLPSCRAVKITIMVVAWCLLVCLGLPNAYSGPGFWRESVLLSKFSRICWWYSMLRRYHLQNPDHLKSCENSVHWTSCAYPW